MSRSVLLLDILSSFPAYSGLLRSGACLTGSQGAEVKGGDGSRRRDVQGFHCGADGDVKADARPLERVSRQATTLIAQHNDSPLRDRRDVRNGSAPRLLGLGGQQRAALMNKAGALSGSEDRQMQDGSAARAHDFGVEDVGRFR
jgi:hypothetical protein